MEIKREKSITIIALAAYGKGISGGDRIFIELARRWSNKIAVTIYLWEEGYEMVKRQRLINQKSKLKINIVKLKKWCQLGFIVCYLARIIKGIYIGLTISLDNESSTIIYNASEFWMDSLPCVFIKIRYPQVQWVATWYQTAPSPLKGFAEGKRNSKYRLTSLMYWIVQLPIKPLIKIYADKVIVNNEEEKKQFPKHTKKEKTFVMIGAVPLEVINKYRSLTKAHHSTKYDAVFQGRFHPQKGVVELIDVWKRVVSKIPNAKLSMIGDGPLMQNVKLKIEKEKLERNVDLLGYVFDGIKKFDIFANSKIVVHPAFYDSGGMASAEAMAFGIPCVGFNLRSYKSYYPKGMIKVSIGDLEAFADTVIELLENESLRKKIGSEAKLMIEENYSWDKRADEVLQFAR